MVEDEDLRVESVRWRPRRFRERGKTSAREEPTRRSSPSTREALARVLAGEPRPGDGACEADGVLRTRPGDEAAPSSEKAGDGAA
jgi:hypothetical protein